MKKAAIDIMFANLEKQMKNLDGKNHVDTLFHKPSGQHLHQCSLIRGDCLHQKQMCAHDYGFRRFTSQKLEKLHRAGTPFMISGGSKQCFMETFVFISHAAVSCNETNS